MTISHLIWTGFLSGMVSFLFGFWRGRRDLRVDLEPLVDRLHDAVRDIPTSCAACSAPLAAVCTRGCPADVTHAQKEPNDADV